ncbi:hypothetical protein FIU85_04720 [Roseovarius sp. THAF8]|nr:MULTISPECIES: hypothetical protein [Roseovarius]QFT96596.1 hypothetical protein FIU85_04720 [Roseovarius sp. THAF8]
MTGLHDQDPDVPTPPTKKRRALFFAFLLLASTLVYVELILRYGN